MIIRRGALTNSTSYQDEAAVCESEDLVFILRKYGLHLGLVCLAAGFSLFGILKTFPDAVARAEWETKLLFQPTALWALPKSGDTILDQLLPTFDALAEAEKIISENLPRERLSSALMAGGFILEETESVQLSLGFSFCPQEGGRAVRVEVDLLKPRKQAPTLLLRSPAPPWLLQKMGKILVEFINEELSHRYLKSAKENREKIVKALEESDINYRKNVERIRAVPAESREAKQALLFEVANQNSLVLFSLAKQLQFLDKDSLINPIVVMGPSEAAAPLPARLLLVLCIGFGLLVYLGSALYLAFKGPPSVRILGEQTLAAIHPQASIYSSGRDAAILDNLLTASLARPGGGHQTKLAAFIPQAESALIEKVRKAAEKSGRSFGSEGSGDGEVTLFSSKDLSDEIARLPAKGYGRILLMAKQGEALKARHRCYQAEADLAGVPITDVVLMEG